LKAAIGKAAIRQKILTSHIMFDPVRSLFPRRKPPIISIEERYSEQTIKRLKHIEAGSSVLLILLPQPLNRASFFVSQISKLLTPPGAKISTAFVSDKSDFKNLMKKSPHDYYIVGPGARGEVPQELRQNPRIVQLSPQIDSASLENARIRSGVVI
jgi:hypothetical protein